MCHYERRKGEQEKFQAKMTRCPATDFASLETDLSSLPRLNTNKIEETFHWDIFLWVVELDPLIGCSKHCSKT